MGLKRMNPPGININPAVVAGGIDVLIPVPSYGVLRYYTGLLLLRDSTSLTPLLPVIRLPYLYSIFSVFQGPLKGHTDRW